MKKIITLLLVVSAIITGSVIVSGILSREETTPQEPASSQTSSEPASQTPNPTGQLYSASAVAERNTKSNCWIIINKSVYDVTEYIDSHPGGADLITEYCGKDATQAFRTQGGEGQHSPSANSILNEYVIGTLQ